MIKKFLLVATMATMALCLCSCDKEDSKNKTETEISELDSDEVSSNLDENSDTDLVETIVAERGSVENDVFTNNSFDISFPIKDTYYVYTDEMIAQLIGFTADSLDENGVISAEVFEESASGCIYDFMFAFEDQQSNVSLIYQNTTDLPSGSQLTAQSYAEMTKYQLENMSSPTYSISEPTTVSYGGYEYVCLDATTDQGYGQMQLIRLHKNYIVVITITYVDGSKNLCTEFLNSLSTVQ